MSENDSLDAFLRRYPTDEKDPGHSHPGSDIEGPMGHTSFIGDIWSNDWDGAIPADLSAGRDLTATKGFYIDTSAGVAQFMGLYWGAGSVSPIATAATWLWTTGAALPVSQTQIASTDVTTGISALGYFLVDMTVAIQVSGLATGQQWWAQAEVGGVAVGLPIYGAAPSSGGAGGPWTTSAEGTGATSYEAVDHYHGSGTIATSNAGMQHKHGVGTLAVGGGASNTGYESSHYHSGPSHLHGNSGTTSYWNCTENHAHAYSTSTGYAGTGSTGAGSSHRHSIPDHSHSVSGQTDIATSAHDHPVSGSTSYSSVSTSHAHTGPSHAHYYSAVAHYHTLAKSTITLRYIGRVQATAGGVIELGVQAAATVAATVDRVQIAYMVWNAPIPPQVELLLGQTLTMYAPEVSNAA